VNVDFSAMTLLIAWLRDNHEAAPGSPLLIVVAVVGGLLLALVFLYFRNRQGRSAIEFLRGQALKRHGKMDVDNRLMSFDYHGAEINVAWSFGRDYSKTGGPSFVYAMFQAKLFPDFSLTIVNNKGGSIAERTLRPRGIDICEDLTVTSNNESLVRELLTPDMQHNLLSYRRRLEIELGDAKVRLGSAIGFEHGPGRFLLRLFNASAKEADYDAVIDTTIMFYDKLKSLAAQSCINDNRALDTNENLSGNFQAGGDDSAND
jgi:hypothetical protein